MDVYKWFWKVVLYLINCTSTIKLRVKVERKADRKFGFDGWWKSRADGGGNCRQNDGKERLVGMFEFWGDQFSIDFIPGKQELVWGRQDIMRCWCSAKLMCAVSWLNLTLGNTLNCDWSTTRSVCRAQIVLVASNFPLGWHPVFLHLTFPQAGGEDSEDFRMGEWKQFIFLGLFLIESGSYYHVDARVFDLTNASICTDTFRKHNH